MVYCESILKPSRKPMLDLFLGSSMCLDIWERVQKCRSLKSNMKRDVPSRSHNSTE